MRKRRNLKKFQKWRLKNPSSKRSTNQSSIKSKANSSQIWRMKNCVIWYLWLSKKWKHRSWAPSGGLTVSTKVDSPWRVLKDASILILGHLVLRTWDPELCYFRSQKLIKVWSLNKTMVGLLGYTVSWFSSLWKSVICGRWQDGRLGINDWSPIDVKFDRICPYS